MIHIPDHARGEQELWEPALMRDALVDAFRTLRALPGGDRAPSMAALRAELNDAWGYADEAKRPPRKVVRAADISHMEILLIGQGGSRGLLNGAVLAYRDQRRVLIRWALWIVGGCRNPADEHETDEDFARRIGYSEATMKRHRDFAASIMAQQANRQDLTVWHVERPVRARKRNLQAAGSV